MKYLMFILTMSVLAFSDQIIPIQDCGIAATVMREGKACFRGTYSYGSKQGAPSLPVFNEGKLLSEDIALVFAKDELECASLKDLLSYSDSYKDIKKIFGFEVSLFPEAVWGGSQSSGASIINKNRLYEI